MPLVPLSWPRRVAELVLGKLVEYAGGPGADRGGVGQIIVSRSLVSKELNGGAAARTMVDTMMHEANGANGAVGANGSAKAQKMEKVAPAYKGKFLEVYSQLKAELLRDSNLFTYTPDSREWVSKMLDYTVPGGKLNRGLSVVDTLALLKKGQLSDEELFRASALGWCIEWLQAYFLIEDDIMDQSVTRRGQLCWYRVPKVGMIAVNDGIILRNHIHQILKRHFKGLPCYTDLLDLYNEVEYQTAFGQTLDLITTPEGEVDLSKYVTSTWEKIVKYKTAYYTFYLPVASALLLAGEKDDNVYRISEDILIQMGTYFQAQDDFLDCYGDPEVIGKIGTDIEDTKCSWLVVKALEKASPEQKERLKEIYGQKDPKKVKEVKALYNDLNLKGAFEEFEEESYKLIIKDIESQASPSLQAVLKTFLGKIYKRQK